MKRVFFRKPILPKIGKKFYKEMVEGCKKFEKANCKNKEGRYNCGDCCFCIPPFCLMSILINEFEEKENG